MLNWKQKPSRDSESDEKPARKKVCDWKQKPTCVVRPFLVKLPEYSGPRTPPPEMVSEAIRRHRFNPAQFNIRSSIGPGRLTMRIWSGQGSVSRDFGTPQHRMTSPNSSQDETSTSTRHQPSTSHGSAPSNLRSREEATTSSSREQPSTSRRVTASSLFSHANATTSSSR